MVLDRWKEVWEALLPKDAGTHYIHMFRNITLIEGNLQYLTNAMWIQALMKEVTEHLNKEQHALRGKVTQSSILSHRLAMDIMFINAEISIIIENDAVNCFGRILIHIAAAAFYRMGVAIGIIGLYMNFVEGEKHHVLLGAKPPALSYSHSQETQIMGGGQAT